MVACGSCPAITPEAETRPSRLVAINSRRITSSPVRPSVTQSGALWSDMGRGRLEAFSDGVIAILITIMVLELKIPEGRTWAALFATRRDWRSSPTR